MTNSLLLALLIFFLLSSAAEVRTITKLSQLDAKERSVVDWVKKYTVPNTLSKNAKPWTAGNLPQRLLSWSGYKKTIKPSAWAAAVASAFAIHEGIFHCGDFYRADSVLIDVRCDACFVYPPQLPPKTTFPTEVFTYSLCQGKSGNPDPKTETYGKICDCSSTQFPGKLIGPNQNCPSARAWQNGMWGMEQKNVASAASVAAVAERIYTTVKGTAWTYRDVLAGTLAQAGFPKGTKIYEDVMRCVPANPKTGKPPAPGDLSRTCADLVSMWLVRNHLAGLAVALHDNDNYKFEERLPTIKTLAEYYSG